MASNTTVSAELEQAIGFLHQWHHEDGRMVKIKKKDFGLRR